MQRRRTIQEIKKIIEDFHKSGLPKNQFCKERKITISSFYKWLKRKDVNEIKLNFIPLSVKNHANHAEKNTTIKVSESEKIILRTLSGISIELPLSTSPEWVLPLLKGLA